MDIQKGAVKKHARNFKNNWLDEDIFKGWLAPHPNDHGNKTFCLLCDSTIRCCRADLMRHSKTAKHIEMVNSKDEYP